MNTYVVIYIKATERLRWHLMLSTPQQAPRCIRDTSVGEKESKRERERERHFGVISFSKSECRTSQEKAYFKSLAQDPVLQA